MDQRRTSLSSDPVESIRKKTQGASQYWVRTSGKGGFHGALRRKLSLNL